jgi:hypothetical protein
MSYFPYDEQNGIRSRKSNGNDNGLKLITLILILQHKHFEQILRNKGNNKITEPRAILQRESQNS